MSSKKVKQSRPQVFSFSMLLNTPPSEDLRAEYESGDPADHPSLPMKDRAITDALWHAIHRGIVKFRVSRVLVGLSPCDAHGDSTVQLNVLEFSTFDEIFALIRFGLRAWKSRDGPMVFFEHKWKDQGVLEFYMDYIQETKEMTLCLAKDR